MNEPENPMSAFQRNADGSWTCVKQTLLQGPFARTLLHPGITFYPGQRFMGTDVVRVLEANKQ